MENKDFRFCAISQKDIFVILIIWLFVQLIRRSLIDAIWIIPNHFGQHDHMTDTCFSSRSLSPAVIKSKERQTKYILNLCQKKHIVWYNVLIVYATFHFPLPIHKKIFMQYLYFLLLKLYNSQKQIWLVLVNSRDFCCMSLSSFVHLRAELHSHYTVLQRPVASPEAPPRCLTVPSVSLSLSVCVFFLSLSFSLLQCSSRGSCLSLQDSSVNDWP